MNKKRHAMIDIETLGNRPTSAIIQVGIVDIFGFKKQWNIDWLDAINKGAIDAETLKWWFNQSDEARKSVTEKETVSLETMLFELNNFIQEREVEFLWSHASFDFPILTNAFNRCGINPKWDFRKLRDLRTIEHFYGDKIEWELRKGVHHNALADADHQMAHLIKMLEVAGDF